MESPACRTRWAPRLSKTLGAHNRRGSASSFRNTVGASPDIVRASPAMSSFSSCPRSPPRIHVLATTGPRAVGWTSATALRTRDSRDSRIEKSRYSAPLNECRTARPLDVLLVGGSTRIPPMNTTEAVAVQRLPSLLVSGGDSDTNLRPTARLRVFIRVLRGLIITSSMTESDRTSRVGQGYAPVSIRRVVTVSNAAIPACWPRYWARARSGDRASRPGPHAVGKWLTGSLARTPEQATASDHAQARDPTHARTWVVLAKSPTPSKHGPRPPI